MKTTTSYNIRDEKLRDALKIINDCDHGILSMVNVNQRPYAIPLSFVVDNNEIYFHCGFSGQKIEIFHNNPYVCFSVIAQSKNIYKGSFTTLYHSFLVNGVIEEEVDNARKLLILKLLCEKYLPDDMDKFDESIQRSFIKTKVFKIKINNISEKFKE